MPFYCYKCLVCGEKHLDFQRRPIGTIKIPCPNKCGDLSRDFMTERPTMEGDWGPGYNVGIDYHYKDKGDLMREIRRRGFYPSRHGGGIASSRTKPGFYGDEEHKELYAPSRPEEYDYKGAVEEPQR